MEELGIDSKYSPENDLVGGEQSKWLKFRYALDMICFSILFEVSCDECVKMGCLEILSLMLV